MGGTRTLSFQSSNKIEVEGLIISNCTIESNNLITATESGDVKFIGVSIDSITKITSNFLSIVSIELFSPYSDKANSYFFDSWTYENSSV